jgi:hypothetical protein
MRFLTDCIKRTKWRIGGSHTDIVFVALFQAENRKPLDTAENNSEIVNRSWNDGIMEERIRTQRTRLCTAP